MINANDRHVIGSQLTRGAQHGAVATGHDRQVCALADLRIGGGRKLADIRVAGCFGFDQYRAPGRNKQAGQVPQVGLQTGVLVTANQRDGGDWHRGVRPENN